MNFHCSERPPPRKNFCIVDPSSSETRHLYRNEKHGAQMHRTDRELVHINYRHCKPALSLPARCSMSPLPRLTIAERFMSIRNQDSPSFIDCTRQREQTEDNKGDKEKHNEQVEENVQEEETVHYLDIPTHQHRHDPRKQHLVDGIKRSVSPTRSINKDHIASSPSQHSVVHPIHEPAHSSFQDPPPGFGTKHDVEAATTDGRQEKTSRAPSMQQRGREQRRFRHAACAVILFTLILALAVGIFVSWPRKPLIRINGSATLTVAPKIFKTEYVNVGNVAFETGWLVRATIDSSDNYIPLPFAPDVVVKDALTSVVVGRLDAKKYEVVTIPPQTLTDVMLPIHIDYEARDVSDTTFSNLRRGCLTDKRESLQLQFWITLHFPALDSLGYRPSLVALPATGGFACPQA